MKSNQFVIALFFVLSTGEKSLTDGGKISHKKAFEKAKTEYKKYQVKTLSPVEKAYLDTIKKFCNKIATKK